MSFRLVPKSVTLNDLERCNSPNVCVISPNSVAFRTNYVKVVAAAEIYAKNVVFSDILFTAIFAKVTENEYIIQRRSHVTGFRHYNITYSLLLSILTTSLIFPRWNDRKLPKIDSAQRKLKSRIFVLKCCYFVTEFSNLFQHITALICGGICARVCCTLYCIYDYRIRPPC